MKQGAPKDALFETKPLLFLSGGSRDYYSPARAHSEFIVRFRPVRSNHLAPATKANALGAPPYHRWSLPSKVGLLCAMRAR